jgi:hypothetical protein
MAKLFLVITALFLLNISALSAQVAVGYYPFQSILSVSSDTENLLWADLRTETNTFFSNLNLETHLMVNISKSPWVNYYSGLGMHFNPFNGTSDIAIVNGYSFNIGARIKPLQDYPNVQLLFEVGPYINQGFDGGLLRTSLGIAYNFRSKK